MTGRMVVLIAGLNLLFWGCGCSSDASGADGEVPVPDGSALETHLVEASWVHAHLGQTGLKVIDARPTYEYLEEHVPGAISASFSEEDATSRGYNVSYGGGLDFFLDAANPVPFQDGLPAQIEAAVQNMGINEGETVVVYDAGGHFHATRFLWTLIHHGFESIFVLDGGMSRWKSSGYATTTDVPAVAPGSFTADEPPPDRQATTDDVFAGLSDPEIVLVSGLQASWHYGSYTAYTIPGHIPGTQILSLGYFFNSDGTWKDPADIQRMLDVVGITPDKSIITYCGGGPLSACAYFTFKYVLGYPNVRNYAESYLGWIADSRRLPVNTYGNDHWLRDTAWCQWWVGDRMQRLMPVSPAVAVDVRPAADYASGHIPSSVNLPMDDAGDVSSTPPGAWAQTLGGLGVGDEIEAVIVDESITPRTTLLFWLLQYLGHNNVSIASDGLAGWEAAGHPVSTADTVIAEPLTPIDVAIQPLTFTADVQSQFRLSSPDETTGYPFSRVWVVSAEQVPQDVPVAGYVHVPWRSNLTDDGRLETAGTLWDLYDNAGVSYFSEIICYSDDPAEASMTFFVLRLLGFPRVAVYVS